MSQFIEMFNAIKKVGINMMVETTWGASPDSSTYNDTGDGVPFYQGKTEFGDLYINNPVTYCTAPVKMAKKYSILMSVRAPVGAVNIATQDCCIGRGLASITPKKDKAETMFIYYALKYMEEEIDRLGTGSTFKAINKDSFAKIQLPEASLEGQRQFVTIAEEADKSEFDGFKSQFIEMFKDSPKMKLSDFCDLKARIGWQGLRHDEFLDEGDYYLVTGVDFLNNKIQWNKCHYVTKERYDQDPNIQLHNGDVLVTKDGTIGKVAMVTDLSTPATLNSGVFVLRDKKGLTINKFLFYSLLTKEFEQFIEDCKTGSTIAHLNQKAFINYLLPTPDIKLQQSFIQIAEQADKSEYVGCYSITKPKAIC